MTDDNTELAGGLAPLQRKYFALLGGEPPKPVPPILVQIYGCPMALLISQLLYWRGKGARLDGFIFKSEKDLKKELGLSSSQQKTLIRKGRDFGFLEVVLKSIPAKRHYRIDYNELVRVTIEQAELKNIALSLSQVHTVQKRRPKIGQNNQTTSYTTQDITTGIEIKGSSPRKNYIQAKK